MKTGTITIPLDTDTAKKYSSASKDEQKKMQILLGLWLREFVESPKALNKVMDEISNKAQDRGLTPENLESLYNS